MTKQSILILAGILAAVAVIVSSSLLRGKGTIALETPGAELELRTGWFGSVTLTSGSGPATAKAGLYQPVTAAIRGTRDDGQWRSLVSRGGPWGKLGRIRVDKAQNTVVRLGPPFTLHADVKQNGRTVSVGLTLIGQAGEHWSGQVMTSEGPAAPPGVQIADESGKTLAEGRFAYG